MVVKGLVACKLHGRNTETITVNHSHQLAGCIHMEVVHWALRRCLLLPLPPRVRKKCKRYGVINGLSWNLKDL